MSRDRQASVSADPNLPHAFVEKLNLPFAMPRGNAGLLAVAPEIAFKRDESLPDCAVCGKNRDDRIHEAAEQAAEAEEGHWPV